MRVRIIASVLVMLVLLAGTALPAVGAASSRRALGGQPGSGDAAPDLFASILGRDGKPLNVLIELDEAPLADIFIAERAKGLQAAVDADIQRLHVQSLQRLQAPIVAEASNYGRVYTQLTNTINGVGVAGVEPRDLAALRKLPGVKAVHPLGTFTYDRGASVPLTGSPQVVAQSGFDGRGVRIAVIDSGLDYTHRDFGGPGTVEAYNFALANAAVLPPAYNGVALFPTPKVIGGFDFVGDTWTGPLPPEEEEITEDLRLTPDPNPLDVVGHGTHVAGIAAGFGVPNSSAGGSIPGSFVRPGEPFTIFHGVAPAAQLVSYKVCSNLTFICDGLAILAALDRAADPNGDGNMNDHVDAINLSLGSFFAASPSAEGAANRAVQAGIAVAASAGNNSDVPFVTGSPGSAERVLSVASTFPTRPLYGLQITAPAPASELKLPFIWQPWSRSLDQPASGALIEARTVATPRSQAAQLGCTLPNGDSPFPAGSLAGRIAIVERGTCAVSEKAFNAQRAGAAGMILAMLAEQSPMVFASAGQQITIPVVAIANPNAQALSRLLRDGAPVEATIGRNVIADLADVVSDFSSRGPSRFGNPKPDLSAPGEEIVSARAGSGSQGVTLSGTSMASPHVAGGLALMKQAHPGWSTQEIEAVLVNTAKTALFTTDLVSVNFERAPISLGGAGRIDLVAAAAADSVVLGDLLAHVGYGFQTVSSATTLTKPVTIRNKGAASKTYDLSVAFETAQPPPGVAISVAPAAVTVAAGGEATATVTIVLQPEALRDWALTNGPGAGRGASLSRVEVAGLVQVAERGSERAYRVPFYVLPRGASDIAANTDRLAGEGFGLVNRGTRTGTVELFSLLINDPLDVSRDVEIVTDRLDIQYVGARLLATRTSSGATVNVVEFAIKTFTPRVLPAEAIFDILIDSDGDDKVDYEVLNVDAGLLDGSGLTGVNVVVVADLAARRIIGPVSLTDTSIYSSGLIMRVPASAIGLSEPRRFNFRVESYWLFPGIDGEEFIDIAPDTGSVAFNPLDIRYNYAADTLRMTPGQAHTIQVLTNASSRNDELGVLLYYRDNASPGRDVDVVIDPARPR